MLAGNIPSLRDAAPDAPEELVRICHRALAFDVNERYATALEMHDDLSTFVENASARVSADDLGRRVGRVFSDERLLLQTIIERQLSRIRESKEGDDAPVGMVTLGRISSGGRTPSKSASRGSETDRAVVAAEEPSNRRSAAWWKGGAFLGAAIGVAAGFAFFLARHEPAVGPPDAPDVSSAARAAPPLAASAQPLPPEIRLRVQVRPSTARIFLDDEPLESNPFERTMTSDTRSHRIRAEAPGFDTVVREVKFETDVLMDFALAPAASATVSAPAVPVAVPVDVAPTSGPVTEPTKRPLDPKDPWAP